LGPLKNKKRQVWAGVGGFFKKRKKTLGKKKNKPGIKKKMKKETKRKAANPTGSFPNFSEEFYKIARKKPPLGKKKKIPPWKRFGN